MRDEGAPFSFPLPRYLGMVHAYVSSLTRPQNVRDHKTSIVRVGLELSWWTVPSGSSVLPTSTASLDSRVEIIDTNRTARTRENGPLSPAHINTITAPTPRDFQLETNTPKAGLPPISSLFQRVTPRASHRRFSTPHECTNEQAWCCRYVPK
jgi:hypothetical protein